MSGGFKKSVSIKVWKCMFANKYIVSMREEKLCYLIIKRFFLITYAEN